MKEMREIKFRFWSNHIGCFVVPDDKVFIGALKDPDMNPMQFTGLTDHHGVDIYEGDIVAIYPHTVKQYRLEEANIYEIKWSDKQCGWDGIFGNIATWSRHEVIGNIHRNPELLGGVK